MAAKRMPRYDVRNDGSGPYAVFYCDECDREFRSNPDIKKTIASDVGRQTLGRFLRNIPVVGDTVADNLSDEDQRYTLNLTPQQLESHWQQVQDRFGECPTCNKVVCLSCFDTQSGYCNDCTPRANEIAEARAEQAGSIVKGFANALGLGDVIRQASQAAQASTQMARCPKDGTLAPAGSKFCPECGSPMVQPSATLCPNCGADVKGAKFCPECGTKIGQTKCANCGAELKGAKFCPECGTKA